MPKSKEFRAFEKLTDRLLAVPRATINERIARYREQVEANPNRRGPKRKVITAPSAGRDERESS